ncbi:SDR family NAD(P)-dependent oxidoreductase [Agrococcus sediminis]|uniref:SDR family NAD(P)-dependent oxidoreductase n=1 Tax=Agrococcus sediminis TaxID=2599924 RepID=A0A5M8QJ12_9MICO|nr:SDR family NAD(P)-dependent oxidoreductase [Agrococcus sediminis]KAA6435258.1 SDR family NAD(P)-dependent oxidoreductase [Agrococcus sediminis]
MRREQLRGRGAVVTGGGGGIGRSIAMALAGAGMDVVVADVDVAAAERVRDEVRALGRRAVAVRCDVSQLAEVEALADAAYRELGDIAVLVNNAGVTWRPYRASWDASVDDFAWIMGVNFWGALHGHRAFVPRMAASPLPSHIVNTSSAATLRPVPGHAAYTASKAAIDGFSMAVRAEYEAAGLDIGVTLLYPGPVRTGFAGSERLRPEADRAETRGVVPWSSYTDGQPMRAGAEAPGAIDPDTVGPLVLDAIEHDRPYVMTHPVPPFLAERARQLTEAAPPAPHPSVE